MNTEVKSYIKNLSTESQAIANKLYEIIANDLSNAEHKIWHRHPVWFLDQNPVVGFSQLKDSVRLLFWSGQSFGESGLKPEGSFMAAEARYTDVNQIDEIALRRWIAKAAEIQWDYKNIVKRKGVLVALKGL